MLEIDSKGQLLEVLHLAHLRKFAICIGVLCEIGAYFDRKTRLGRNFDRLFFFLYSTTQANEVKVICMNCMAMVNDHCTARCPKIKCKLCSKFGHVKRDCPRLKSKIKDYTKEKHEKDNDLIVYWGGHCDVCKQGVRNLLAKKPLKPLKEFPPNSLTPPQGSPSLSRAETSARA